MHHVRVTNFEVSIADQSAERMTSDSIAMR